MGGGKKPTAPAAPTYQGAATMYGNELTGRTYLDPKYGIVNQYLPTQAQQDQEGQYNRALGSLLPSLGQTSQEEQGQINSSKNAYINQAQGDFDRMYAPQQRQLREDFSSRFGTLNASPYVDAVNNMESQQRVPAYQNIANTAEQYANQLYQQQQQTKLQQLSALLSGQGQSQGYYQQGLANPLQAGGQLNQFNQGVYGTQGGIYQSQLAAANRPNPLLSLLGTAGGAYLASI